MTNNKKLKPKESVPMGETPDPPQIMHPLSSEEIEQKRKPLKKGKTVKNKIKRK